MSEIIALFRSGRAFLGSLKHNLEKKNLKPHKRVDSVANIELKYLRRKQITHIFVDMDNTITSYHGEFVDKLIRKKFRMLCQNFRVYLFSNSDQKHIDAFMKKNKIFLMHHVPLKGRKKPSLEAYKYVLKKASANPKHSAMIGDRYFTDIVGAKKCGFKLVIKTKPLLAHTEPIILKAIRKIEQTYVKFRNVQRRF